MKEDWELTIEKASQNVIAAKLLHGKDLYGLSAYHAQQAVELSIKAGAYKLGFLQYIHKNYPLYEHNPSKIILGFVYDYLIETVLELEKSDADDSIKKGVSEIMGIFRLLKKTLFEADGDKGLKEKLWKISLKIPVNDEKIQTFLNTLEEYSNNRITVFLNNAMHFAQDMVSDGIHILKKTRHQEIIYRVIRDTEKSFEEHDLPPILVKSAINRDSETWEREIMQLIQRRGQYETLDLIFGPNGALEMLNNPNLQSRGQKWSARDRLKIMWMTYVATISPLALLIHPHEVFGRYPEDRPDFNTEKIYFERRDELRKMIEECELAHQRINKMLI